MNVVSSTGDGLLDRIGASRPAFIAAPIAAPPAAVSSAGTDSLTSVALGRSHTDSTIYSDPRARPGTARLWSSTPAQDDPVSLLMARNRGVPSYSLGDKWRGLGGALLARFGKTGEGYVQTLVDEPFADLNALPEGLSPEERARRSAGILARQGAELAGIATHGSTAGLKLQTRSGQSLELRISVDTGVDGVAGISVSVSASGAMSEKERGAVAQLASGLDRALEGLGRDDAVGLDLSGLTSYDPTVFASIELTAKNGLSHQALRNVSLHLGDDSRSITLEGRAGTLSLKLDATSPPAGAAAAAAQRRAAILRMLDRIDGAAERAHADAALVQQLKSAFETFQAPAGTAEASGDAGGDAGISGLSDFEASFGGETLRNNRFGTTHEAGRADYRLSQKTETRDTGSLVRSVAQTVSEEVSADYLTAVGADAVLDVRNGPYADTHIRDRSTVTTLVESVAGHVGRVLREADERQAKTVTDYEQHRAVRVHAWPTRQVSLAGP